MKRYKTDPTSTDTDGDNLTDYDEIFEYETNPLRVDTDGDGKHDGIDNGTVCFYLSDWSESKPWKSGWGYDREKCFDDRPGISVDKSQAKKLYRGGGIFGLRGVF